MYITAKYDFLQMTLEAWGSTWGMRFNAKKCNILRVIRKGGGKPLLQFYTLDNQILQEVSDAKISGYPN